MKKNIVYVTFFTLAILLIPFLTQAPWTLSDFIIAGIFLFGIGCILTFGACKLKTKSHRIIFVVAVLSLGAYIWAELAVGIFTTLGS